VSRAALDNPDRRRELRELEIPADVRALLEPGSRTYMMGACRIIVSQQRAGWHLSISRAKRLPSWEDVRDARYALIPDEALMALLLPPRDEYVNVHEFCLQLYEIPRAYIDELQDRLR
jgi:hypothetical protein